MVQKRLNRSESDFTILKACLKHRIFKSTNFNEQRVSVIKEVTNSDMASKRNPN